MTLLLGPPSSGKTTLLLALAGRFDPSLRVEGEISYNGHKLNEFEPRRTATYISQNDIHAREMTVKETLDFSAKCQGVGSRLEMLTELARREKEAGIIPEAEVGLFMKATAIEGDESSLITYYTLRVNQSSSNARCVEKLLAEEAAKGLSIFDELHGTLSAQQGEIAVFARELRKRFNDSIHHTTNISEFINGVFDKLMEGVYS
ncbi:putative ABC-type sulfate transporter [Helianthus annuus]|uniref:Sulfate-transporting ATPase n=1 Tax=Helianthus annuus TaxID=4232 RepID=A0A9K3EBQ6_HELAN|nr:putative sulfate-transporting ATPase [Helianthus annuus]KAJ0465191.1 putative ABC-type sulfate transporter [Helianthus annuus]KAJ0486783.1 putative ABC-type sulfate transporter [Helianthus annuus]KAJ0660916.1 putative ABC-type sulfate transporter [Helianthus annuus]KAJ0841430.1 putative ABC-type sulfate transporter [Helianthus annuus]